HRGDPHRRRSVHLHQRQRRSRRNLTRPSPSPACGEGRGEGPLVLLQQKRPHPPFGHLLPQAGEGTKLRNPTCPQTAPPLPPRSEERRVGKERRARRVPGP